MEIDDQLVDAERNAALSFLAAAIHELTIAGRDGYGSSGAESHLMLVNEAIHRLSGHLRDLCDLQEPLTRGRAQGIVAAIELIDRRQLDRVLAQLHSLGGQSR